MNKIRIQKWSNIVTKSYLGWRSGLWFCSVTAGKDTEYQNSHTSIKAVAWMETWRQLQVRSFGWVWHRDVTFPCRLRVHQTRNGLGGWRMCTFALSVITQSGRREHDVPLTDSWRRFSYCWKMSVILRAQNHPRIMCRFSCSRVNLLSLQTVMGWSCFVNESN